MTATHAVAVCTLAMYAVIGAAWALANFIRSGPIWWVPLALAATQIPGILRWGISDE